ncbi:MAG: hypothetical protein NVS9B7_14410 [Flavisolibacter sp.]
MGSFVNNATVTEEMDISLASLDIAGKDLNLGVGTNGFDDKVFGLTNVYRLSRVFSRSLGHGVTDNHHQKRHSIKRPEIHIYFLVVGTESLTAGEVNGAPLGLPPKTEILT